MIESVLELLKWEYEKYKKRGYWVVMAVVLFYSYLAYIPGLLQSILMSLPECSSYKLFTLGSFIIHLFTYLIVNSLFALAYYMKSPSIEFYKVSPEPWPWENNPNFRSIIISVIKTSLFNNIIVVPTISMISGLRTTYETNLSELPSIQTIASQIFFFMILEDFCFYTSHKLLHTSYLYKKIHKQHHEFNVTISISSEYTHPIEYLIGNIFPLGAGPRLYGSSNIHIITWYMWLMLRSIHTAEGHSGYDVPFSPFRLLPFSVSSWYHDYHHLKSTGNYSSFFVFWDFVFGDNKKFLSRKLE